MKNIRISTIVLCGVLAMTTLSACVASKNIESPNPPSPASANEKTGPKIPKIPKSSDALLAKIKENHLEYELIRPFSNDRAAAKDRDGKWFHIDKSGEPIYPKRYALVLDYENNETLVKAVDGITVTFSWLDDQGNDFGIIGAANNFIQHDQPLGISETERENRQRKAMFLMQVIGDGLTHDEALQLYADMNPSSNDTQCARSGHECMASALATCASTFRSIGIGVERVRPLDDSNCEYLTLSDESIQLSEGILGLTCKIPKGQYTPETLKNYLETHLNDCSEIRTQSTQSKTKNLQEIQKQNETLNTNRIDPELRSKIVFVEEGLKSGETLEWSVDFYNQNHIDKITADEMRKLVDPALLKNEPPIPEPPKQTEQIPQAPLSLQDQFMASLSSCRISSYAGILQLDEVAITGQSADNNCLLTLSITFDGVSKQVKCWLPKGDYPDNITLTIGLEKSCSIALRETQMEVAKAKSTQLAVEKAKTEGGSNQTAIDGYNNCVKEGNTPYDICFDMLFKKIKVIYSDAEYGFILGECNLHWGLRSLKGCEKTLTPMKAY